MTTDLVVDQDPLDEAMRLRAELKAMGALTATSCQVPAWITYEQWTGLVVMFAGIHNESRWALADLMAFGEDAFSLTYAQAEAVTALNRQTLMNYASIARHIPRSRRKPQLTFSVHAEVAYMPPAERDEWLDKAVRNDWKREELREHIRASREDELMDSHTGTTHSIHCTCPRCGNEHIA